MRCGATVTRGEGSPVFIQSFDPEQFAAVARHDAAAAGAAAGARVRRPRARSPTTPMRSASPRRWRPPRRCAAAHAAGSRFTCGRFAPRTNFCPLTSGRGSAPAAHGDLAARSGVIWTRGIDGFFTDFPAIGVAVAGCLHLRPSSREHQPLTDDQFAREKTAGPVVVAGRALQLQAVVAGRPCTNPDIS